MLRKLLKYETKATARLFIPLYFAVLIFAVANKLLNPFGAFETSTNLNLHIILSFISYFIYFALIISIIVMTFVIMIQRFYKNLLGDEGYLMFTLPVKTWKHIVSKILVAMMWIILSFLTVLYSILILVDTSIVLRELPNIFKLFIDNFGYTGLIIMPLYALIASASNIIMIYAAIALGHLIPKHKLLASFGMYGILYIAYQTILTLFIFAFKNTIFASIISSTTPTPSMVNTFLISLALISTVLIMGHFILINFTLKKKLNLE